jgi:hypothetical protein
MTIKQFHLDLVSLPRSPKVSPQSGPVQREFDPLLGTSERKSETSPRGRKKNYNNFGVNEWPDSSLLQARVCGSMAEKLWSLSGSVLWFRGDPYMAFGGVGKT